MQIKLVVVVVASVIEFFFIEFAILKLKSQMAILLFNLSVK